MEAQSASYLVMGYKKDYELIADTAAQELMTALQGAIRYGADPAESQQLRAHLARWQKKRRSQCKSPPDRV